jgi:hypothetical protein
LGPNDLRAIKLSTLRKPELGLKLTGIEGFISRHNHRIDVGKVDPSNGLIGVGDLYDITLIGLLCEISSGHIDHVQTNKCEKIESASTQKTTPITEEDEAGESDNLSYSSDSSDEPSTVRSPVSSIEDGRR